MDTPPDKLDLLAREPAVLTGALIGYARVSTTDQILDRQTRALAEAGCLRVFAEKKTGVDSRVRLHSDLQVRSSAQGNSGIWCVRVPLH